MELGLSYVDLDKDSIPLIKDLGVKTLYGSIRWCNVEPKKGQFNWDTYDYEFAMEAKHNLSSVRAISHTPRWAARPVSRYSIHTSPPADMGDWKKFIKELVLRYPGRTWTVWAEPDNYPPRESNHLICWTGTAEDYGELMMAAYTTAKKHDPSCKIGMGGLVGATINGSHPYSVFGGQSEDRLVFLEDLVSYGYLDCCDFIGLDCYAFGYGGIQNVRKGISRVRQMTRRKEMWILETGCKLTRIDKIDEQQYKQEYGHEIISQETSAGLMLSMCRVAEEFSIPKMFWLTLRDSDWGLVNRLGRKHLSYYMFRMLAGSVPRFD